MKESCNASLAMIRCVWHERAMNNWLCSQQLDNPLKFKLNTVSHLQSEVGRIFLNIRWRDHMLCIARQGCRALQIETSTKFKSIENGIKLKVISFRAMKTSSLANVKKAWPRKTNPSKHRASISPNLISQLESLASHIRSHSLVLQMLKTGM